MATVDVTKRVGQIAGGVSSDLESVGVFGISPSVIAAIIGGIVMLFQKCNNEPVEALARMQSDRPTRLEKLVRRRQITKHAGRLSRDDREAVEEALLDAADRITVDDVKTMYQECEECEV